jgi:hypothetical protein
VSVAVTPLLAAIVGFGDDREKARRSIESAQERMRAQAPLAD